MQHLQLQKHEGSTLQMQLLCIVPSCEYHIDVVTFEMGLSQSGYFQYMSAMMMEEMCDCSIHKFYSYSNNLTTK